MLLAPIKYTAASERKEPSQKSLPSSQQVRTLRARLRRTFWFCPPSKPHGFPAIITRCTNNYGPYQFHEKFIPLMISRALAGESLPIYGDGKNIRDWIHVEDHCRRWI